MRALLVLLGLLGLAQCKVIEAGGVGGDQTVITGDGNTVATAIKPGPMSTGAGATATDAKKADAVVVGDGSQASSAHKGPSVAGQGNVVTPPATSSSWWKWLLGVVALGYLVPKLVKLGCRFV